MKKLFSKFKFKWWSWEIDTLKLLPIIFLVLAFLPILPYKKKDGKLISFLGTEALNNNFYNLIPTNTFYLLNQYSDEEDTVTKKYYLKKGFSDKKATCLAFRDFVINQVKFENKLSNSLDKYTFSPVPAIWVTRLITREFLNGNIAKVEFNSKYFNKTCGDKFRELILPPGYLSNKFNN
tara:strand:- start:135 stop:671 length:537 start_codon:yes stop_codon:yes gene_type:complete